MSKGVPFDVAFSLDDITRTAFSIAFSEMDGAKFSWDRMEFAES